MKKYTLFLVLFVILTACVSQNKYDSALKTIDSLKVENAHLVALNDELENGESRLTNKYIDYVAHGKYMQAEDAYNALSDKHPNALNNSVFSNIKQVKAFAKNQRDSVEKAVRDSIFMSNINELGAWNIGNYVDDFDEPTGEHFVYQRIFGEFSNSATAGSRLSVVIRIYKSKYSSSGIDYSLDIDEYNDGTKDESYLSVCKIVSKEQHKVYTTNYGGPFFDRDDEDAKYSFLDILRKGSTYEITDSHREYSLTTTYNFTIDSRYLDNALVKAEILSPSDILNN